MLLSFNFILSSRGRGMPPHAAAARGGVSRGGPARGGAVRGAPAGRGGPPAAPARGAVAPRARPPAGGPPQRMAPPPAHQHTTGTAAESYDEYVSLCSGCSLLSKTFRTDSDVLTLLIPEHPPLYRLLSRATMRATQTPPTSRTTAITISRRRK